MVDIAEGISAIDVHVHLSDGAARSASPDRASWGQISSYFGRERAVVPIDEMAEQYRSKNMMAVIMNSTNESITGVKGVPNDYIAEVVAKHPDVFIGFGIVDPWQGKLAELEMRRCKEELGLAGIGELNPARQRFAPNDTHFYPLWNAASELGLPILFHGGFAGAGAGTPGGMGVKLRYSNPMLLDDLAADFPQLRIICAHPSWPWSSEALAVTLHKSNVYLDLSGWSPKYLPEEVRHYANSRIQNKVLFGTDWPLLDLDRFLEEFEQLDFKPEVREKILVRNARALFEAV
jgi:predicted TIM-barrel fold metal-dependent hydrolase